MGHIQQFEGRICGKSSMALANSAQFRPSPNPITRTRHHLRRNAQRQRRRGKIFACAAGVGNGAIKTNRNAAADKQPMPQCAGIAGLQRGKNIFAKAHACLNAFHGFLLETSTAL